VDAEEAAVAAAGVVAAEVPDENRRRIP